MRPPISIDLSRLFLSPLNVTPRGIDRIELAYAKHFFASWPGECVPVLPMPWGIRWYDRRRAIDGLKFIDDLWRENQAAAEDAVYRTVKARLLDKAVTVVARRPSPCAQAAGFLRGLSQTGLSLGRSVPGSLPQGSFYLHVGQLALSMSPVVSWLARRPDVTGVFMLHDVIPLEHPEHVEPSATKAHQRMVLNTARFAKGLIVTTTAARESILKQISGCGRKNIAVSTVALPVPCEFLGTAESDADLEPVRYFVACGTLDPRKNYLLLLNIWRELVRTVGDSAPRLVIVGSRSSNSGSAATMIDRCESLRRHVIEASGLSTPGLRSLIISACGLLMPSVSEGFGLPIVEALSQGTPVIASDIAAHREAGGPYATYVNAIDGIGWMEAIGAHAQAHGAASPFRLRASGFHPTRWSDYFSSIEGFLESLRAGQQLPSLPVEPSSIPTASGKGLNDGNTRKTALFAEIESLLRPRP